MNKSNTTLYFLLILIAIIVLLILIVVFAQFINEFSRELKYLNNEIRRTTGDERKHWRRQKRRLLLSLIPFVKY